MQECGIQWARMPVEALEGFQWQVWLVFFFLLSANPLCFFDRTAFSVLEHKPEGLLQSFDCLCRGSSGNFSTGESFALELSQKNYAQLSLYTEQPSKLKNIPIVIFLNIVRIVSYTLLEGASTVVISNINVLCPV